MVKDGLYLSFALFFAVLELGFLHANCKTYWQDLQVLKQFKNSIHTDSITPGSCLSSWDFTVDPCDNLFSDKFTCGFRCDVVLDNSNASRVTELTLDQAGYSASLTSVSWKLPYLQKLDLSGNYFTGEIPDSFSFLTQIQQLTLSRNSLSGWLTDSLAALSTLQELYLDNNNLQGTIPSAFNGLQNLKRLEIQGNNLTGEFPSLSDLGNLDFLDASNNAISGQLPQTFPASLVQLSMRNNSIEGNVPTSITSLIYLQVLDLSYNKLSGSVPASLFTHPSLQQLALSHNQFGAIDNPGNSGSDSQLIAIDLANNQIRGFLPVFLGTLPELSALTLENNKFSGMIPAQYTLRVLFPGQGASPFERLLLGGNYLIGPIPSPFLELQPGSVTIRLGDNCLYRCPLRLFFCSGGVQKPIDECKAFGPYIP